MPRPRTSQPRQCHDTWSGRDYVIIADKKRDLGPHDSPEARDKYIRLLAEWSEAGRPVVFESRGGSITVHTLVALWIAAYRELHRLPDTGKRRPVGELGNYYDVLHDLIQLYGKTPAREFGPKRLKALRNYLITDRQVTYLDGRTVSRKGMSRKVVNRNIDRIKAVFKWGVAEELLVGEVWHRLSAVVALPPGSGQARETDPVGPVAEERWRAVLPFLPRHVAAMVKLQYHGLGLRPNEVCSMRWEHIDRNARDPETDKPQWVYKLPHHKTAHKGKKRIIPLGETCQAILGEFLPLSINPAGYVFSPAESEVERNTARCEARKTPLTPSQRNRAEQAAARKRRQGERYSVAAYGRALARACEQAFGMPAELRKKKGDTPEQKREKAAARVAWHAANSFSPNQIRHSFATDASKRDEGRLEAVQQALGHADSKTTRIYVEPDVGLAQRLAREIG